MKVVTMTRSEMKFFVEESQKNTDRETAIKDLAYLLKEEEPVCPEVWFQQKIGGE